MKSCLYIGSVIHHRYAPKKHQFSYKLFLSYLDLDELDDFFSKSKLWSLERFNFVSFKRSNYHGDKARPLKEEVLNTVEEKIGHRPDGPVRLLTNLSFFGYCFNSVSFYYCFKKDGEQLDALMAEIENTPWGERYCYVFSSDHLEDETLRVKLNKEFHISPFFPMEMKYLWNFSLPKDKLSIKMESLNKGQRVFFAGLDMVKEDVSTHSLNNVFLKHPVMTFKMIVGIYLQAFILWLKRVPFYEHPNPKSRRSILSNNKEGLS